MTTVLSTIPSTAEAPSAPAETKATPTAGDSPEVSETMPEAAVEESGKETQKATVKEEPKADPDLEIARKLDLVAKREARARKQEATLQQKLSDLQAKESAIEKKMAELDSALEDPISYYLQKGKDPVEVAKRFAKPMSEEEKRLAAVEKRLAAEDEDRKKSTEREQKQRQEQQRHALMRQFVSEIDKNEYPHLTTVYEPHQIPGLVTRLLNEPQDPTDPESPSLLEAFRARYDRAPTNKEIRDALEHKAEIYASRVYESVSARRKPTSSQVTPATPTATPNGEESTSLSNQHAASSPSGPPRTKSREDVMKEIRAELEAEVAATST